MERAVGRRVGPIEGTYKGGRVRERGLGLDLGKGRLGLNKPRKGGGPNRAQECGSTWGKGGRVWAKADWDGG